ncbi:hypothetical protein PPERSA_06783 [Pseudocohnilembus persalinus]|uniref:Uncharacterized protein n=1 Tax=Pseudocohnilembus persalinus TaxID=266149 RepID=A0A0V0QSL4_PSEPJ|nr:hypothetical protein PPERSA_06783 [Pseudocohnilembus persalinus]|eukprot:KRX05149.1 hypothetical protein PPERSA_06783 [Pseudocohnilembus persalinus]
MIQNTDSQQLQNKREQFQVDIRNDSRKAILERRRQRFNTQNIQAKLSNNEIFKQLKNNNQGLDEEEAKENTSYDQAQINVENILQAIEQQINMYTKLKQNFSSLNQDQYLELTNILANLVGLTYNSGKQLIFPLFQIN